MMLCTEYREISSGEYSPSDLDLSRGGFLFEGSLQVNDPDDWEAGEKVFGKMCYISPCQAEKVEAKEACKLLIFPGTLSEMASGKARHRRRSVAGGAGLQKEIVLGETGRLGRRAPTQKVQVHSPGSDVPHARLQQET